MTEMNKKDLNKEITEDVRLKRRKLLKAGAMAVPVAVTLHGGTAFAQVHSAYRCVDNIKNTLPSGIPQFDNDGNQVGTTEFDPVNGLTGRQITDSHGNTQNETHWDYLNSQGIDSNHSCMNSFFSAGMPTP